MPLPLPFDIVKEQAFLHIFIVTATHLLRNIRRVNGKRAILVIAITVLFLVDYRVRFLLGFDLELVDLVRLFIELDALLAHVRAGGADAVLLSRAIVLLLKLATVAVLLLLLIAALVDQFL